MQIGERQYDARGRASLDDVPAPVLQALRANQDCFSDLAWFRNMELETRSDDFKQLLPGQMVSPNFFALCNVRAELGRTFGPSDAVSMDARHLPERDAVIVLSDSWWRTHFAADASILGKSIELSGRRFTVVGVMPAHFQFPRVRRAFWVAAADARPALASDTSAEFGVLAVLKPGAKERQAQAMLDTVAHRLMAEHATDTQGYGAEWRKRPHGLGLWMQPLHRNFPKNPGTDNFQRTLFGLFSAMGFVLLIVCLNIASLTLARAERRQQEWAIRAALGASPGRLLFQSLTESLLLACLGGAAALVVTVWVGKLLVLLIPQNMPRLRDIQVDGPALVFALLICVVIGLGCGLAAAVHTGGVRLSERLKQAGTSVTEDTGRNCFRRALVMIEVALTVVLLSGAGLMTESVARLLRVNPGFDPENLLFVNLWLPEHYADAALPGGPENRRQSRNTLLEQVQGRLVALPGVKAVGIYGGGIGSGKLRIGGRSEPVELYGQGCGVAESDFFRAMRVPLLAGRYFDKSDVGEKANAVIINESMARLCWPGENALGQRFRDEDTSVGGAYEVIGVVADTRPARYTQTSGPQFYQPYHCAQFEGDSPSVMLVIRTLGHPQRLIPAIQDELRKAEPELWKPRIVVVRESLFDSTRPQRTYMLYLVAFASLGLFLSALGLYGVLASLVTRRTRELGIRAALGAERGHLLGIVVWEGARLVGIGLACGLIAASWLTRLLRQQLFEVRPADPGVLAAVVAILCLVALLACLLPALRATKISPIEALRCE
jgi:putative ABC transport system permease protein